MTFTDGWVLSADGFYIFLYQRDRTGGTHVLTEGLFQDLKDVLQFIEGRGLVGCEVTVG